MKKSLTAMCRQLAQDYELQDTYEKSANQLATYWQ